MTAITTAATAATATTTTGAEAATASSSPESFGADGRLVAEAAAAQLASLFREHARLVLRICRSMLRDRVEAEDAAQQAFLSAYASLLSGRSPRDDVAWIATIARNECRHRIRARMCEPLVELDDDATLVGGDVHETAIRRSEVEALRRALVDLPSQQRQAFVLREFAGLSYEELAEALSVSLASVESLLFRARRGLRTRLEPALAGVNGALSIPLMLRDLLLRLATGGGGESAGAASKIASLPIAAKVAAAAASAGLLAGGAVGIEVHGEHAQAGRHTAARVRPRSPAPKPQSAPETRAAPRPAPPAAPAAAVLVSSTKAPQVAHHASHRRGRRHHEGNASDHHVHAVPAAPVSHRGRGDGRHGRDPGDDGDVGGHGSPQGPDTPVVIVPPAAVPTGDGGPGPGDGDGHGGDSGGDGSTVVVDASGGDGSDSSGKDGGGDSLSSSHGDSSGHGDGSGDHGGSGDSGN